MIFVLKNKMQILACLVCLAMLQLLVAGTGLGKAPDSRHEHIKSHTSGVISKKDSIKVRFVQNAITKEQIGQESDIFSFSPLISGKGKWTALNEAAFTPDSPLAPGKYQATIVNLETLFANQENSKPFSFSFEVIGQTFEMEVDGLKSDSDDEDEHGLYIAGMVRTADEAENFSIEEALKAVQNGSDLKVSWNHDSSEKTSRFIVGGIRRFKQESEARLYFDGNSIGVKDSQVVKIPVPAAGSFKAIQAKAIQDKHNCILIRFSDSLDPDQNLKGLIHSPGRRYKFGIEGNLVRVYPPNPVKGTLDIRVEPGIRNIRGEKLKKASVHTINFLRTRPQVRFTGKGTIIPAGGRTLIPFEAVGLKSVQATAFLVYEKNMGQFLQVNTLKGSSQMRRVGRYLWRKTIPLKSNAQNIGKWTRYHLDAGSLFKEHPNELFRISLSFNRENSAFPCSESEHAVPAAKEAPYKNYDEMRQTEKSFWDFYQQPYIQNGWRNRNNPCHESYYSGRYVTRSKSRNFMASNIGLIAKRGENQDIHAAAADIVKGKPLSDTLIKVYNFQNRMIGQAETDSQGLALVKVDGRPFYMTAEKGEDKGYLRLNSGAALPTSHFDVGGEKTPKGVKGYIYGERGVWRPGDSIYLTIALEDKRNILPPNHPVTMRLHTPRGRLFQSAVKTSSVMNFYSFHMKTDADSPTGTWRAVALVGGMKFEKKIKIETVIPNRLKVKLDFGVDSLEFSKKPFKGTIFSQWLHGAPAKFLKTDVYLNFSPMPVGFDRFRDFTFEDPSRSFNSRPMELFRGKLNEKGRVDFAGSIRHWGKPAGMLKAEFSTRVFEEGGAFSKDYFSLPYHPYGNYVGLKLPKGDVARGMLLTDTVHEVNIAALSSEGKPVSLDKVRVSLYKIKWKWWWDKSKESLARYAESSHARAVKSEVIEVRRGSGKWSFEVKHPSWGRYLIRACDLRGRHCAGKTFYIDWPGWAGNKQEEKGVGATRLNFSSDKAKYEVGETAVVRLPASPQGVALVSIENGSRVLSKHWTNLSGKGTRLEIPITSEMSPNVYVSVSLIQPHQGKRNDRPIRLYGIIPLLAENPDAKLSPELESAETLQPDSETIVKISEKKGRAMAYTIAVVDEGLLGLTRYRTPDLREEFYKKESLGVRTWDIYDEVIGAYGAKLERILALGGSGFASGKKEPKKRRFPPVAKFFGPFLLDENGSNKHRIRIPQYIGAVRIMVVAGNQKAYGSVERTVPVKQPLMLLATMPRVLGTNEEVRIPVNVFAMNENIKEVKVSAKTDDFLLPLDALDKTVSFERPGDKIAFFHFKTASKQGMANIQLQAGSRKWKSAQEINVAVRNPNSKTAIRHKGTAPPWGSFETLVAPHGLAGTRTMTLELSSIPPVNLERHLRHLIRYPHGCVEQTVSAAFPQLYLSSLTELTQDEKDETERNVKDAIKRLRGFQLDDGGFSYWPGGSEANDWGTAYAGHFLIEASNLGFNVHKEMLEKWRRHQYKASSSWKSNGVASDLVQSYRLYALALLGRPNLSAMNRLKESGDLGNVALWRLAAAYGLAGQEAAQKQLLKRAGMEVEEYTESGSTFGSALRDKAIILESLIGTGRGDEAGALAEEIAAALSEDVWRSTQTSACALLALAKFYGTNKSDFSFRFGRVMGEGGEQTFKSSKGVTRQVFEGQPHKETKLVIRNPNAFPIHVAVSAEGVPEAGKEKASSEGLALEAEYESMSGDGMDAARLSQGADFIVVLKVTNPTKRNYKNLALSYIAPSGWDIHNPRLDGSDLDQDKFDYRDIRDDRVYVYFDLKAEKEKTFRIRLNASWLGRYYLPAVSVENMYDAARHARIKGRWVEVVED